MSDKKDRISRRGLLKATGAGLAGAAAVYGLNKLGWLPGAETPLPPPPTDKMTCRTHPRSGDAVSLLGFGCMRLPLTGPAADPARLGQRQAGRPHLGRTQLAHDLAGRPAMVAVVVLPDGIGDDGGKARAFQDDAAGERQAEHPCQDRHTAPERPAPPAGPSSRSAHARHTPQKP